MMNKAQQWLGRISLLAVVVALIVIALGALTRLSDAGLGCPDWPGCYGHLGVPQSADSPQKAWIEMVHRYVAGTFALLVISVAVLSVLNAAKRGISYLVLAFLLFAVVVYQALLGMWTVTLKLWPIVVMQHLLGGMTLLGLLWWAYLKSRNSDHLSQPVTKLRVAAIIGLLLMFFQIALGAWTSTNYASLSCDSFPFCQTGSPVSFDFSQAFKLFSADSINYEGGVLSEAARQTIQMTHRFGALVLLVYLSLFSLAVLQRKLPLRAHLIVLLALLLLQIGLGIINVLFQLPLVTAVLHTLVAAVLLCIMILVNFKLAQGF